VGRKSFSRTAFHQIIVNELIRDLKNATKYFFSNFEDLLQNTFLKYSEQFLEPGSTPLHTPATKSQKTLIIFITIFILRFSLILTLLPKVSYSPS
jgi:hypothetical protein